MLDKRDAALPCWSRGGGLVITVAETCIAFRCFLELILVGQQRLPGGHRSADCSAVG